MHGLPVSTATVTISQVGRDNNQPTKLYGASGLMAIYQRYLANQTPTPLVLTPPECGGYGRYDGNFVCSGGMRTLPVDGRSEIRCAASRAR